MSEQDNDAMVDAFLLALSFAGSDSIQDAREGQHIDKPVYRLNGFYVNRYRLGQALRAVKAANA